MHSRSSHTACRIRRSRRDRPTYGVRYRDRLKRTIANEDHPERILGAFHDVYRVLKSDTFCVSFYGWNHTDLFLAAWRRAGFVPVGHLVWQKNYASRRGFLEARHEQACLLELAAKGTINIRRAYGNWKNQAGWEARLHPFAIQPIQQFSYTKGKNALDMCMAIDAMDLLYTEKVDCFALVTSGSDFTPLVIKLLSKGKTVIGFGESKTPEPFVKACSVFIHTDDFKEPSAENPQTSVTTRKTKKELRGDTELLNVLRAAVESMKDENGFASMTRIGQYISNHSSLSSKNYGYARWSDLIRATEYFDESVGENH